MNKVLIITYYWPPSGGAGVQRWLKFVKYLQRYDWCPVVLTVDTEYAAYPFTDNSLENDIPEGVEIYRTRATNYFSLYSRDASKVPTAGFSNSHKKGFKDVVSRFIRGNFFIPDPRKGWNRYAIEEASRLIREQNITHIITTSPPHSTQLIGIELKKRFKNIKWLADLRDPWTDIYYYNQFYHLPLAKAIDKKYECKTLQKADTIITVGNNLAKIFYSKVDGIEAKTVVIPNGYDEDDFVSFKNVITNRFTITYIGTIAHNYPIEPIISALSVLDKDGYDFLFRFIGSIHDSIKKNLSTAISPDKLEIIPYVEHSIAIEYMSRSSVLLLIIPDNKNNKVITTGKLFEYLATGKPILLIGPDDGDAAGYLDKTGYDGVFQYTDNEDVYRYLLQNINNFTYTTKEPAKEYSRNNLTRKLVNILNSI